MVNVDTLRSELEFVTRNQSHHKQSLWFEEYPDNACKTKGCLAGWTAIHHGKDRLVEHRSKHYIGNDKYINMISYEPVGGTWTGLGADLLDINWYIADELFHADNSLWDLWNIANVISNGAIEIPEAVEAMKDDFYNRTEGNEEEIREMLEEED